MASFVCQRCAQPLRVPYEYDIVDASLLVELHSSNTPSALGSPSSPHRKHVSPPHNRIHSTSPQVVRRSVHPRHHHSFLSSSPTLEDQPPQSQSEQPSSSSSSTWTAKLKTAARFFDLLSSQSDLDHPLCQECADMLVDTLDRQVSQAQLESELYRQFIAQNQHPQSTADQQTSLQDDVDELKREEEKWMRALQEVQSQRAALQQQLLDLDQQERQLDLMEQQYWHANAQYESQLMTEYEQLQSLDRQLDYTSSHLEKLRKANVYNDAFHIWHDGPFGTINGFRLGRLPDHPVEWTEINAAWGQAVLLLSLLADKMGYTFQQYRLVPLGSFSRIEKMHQDRAVYEMYGAGDLQLTRLFWNRRFDLGMVAYLHCLNELAIAIASLPNTPTHPSDPSFKLPYDIQKDKIGEVSIRTQFNTDEVWTRALKYTLTDLKWILAFCCRHQSGTASLAGESQRPSVTT